MALDVEKHEIVKSIAHELVFYDRKLANFKAKKGFAALQICLDVQSGVRDFPLHELPTLSENLREAANSLTGTFHVQSR